MASVTLKRERPVLTVNIGDETEVGVPLTLTHDEFEQLGKAKDPGEGMLWYFRKYLGDVVDVIGDDDLSALMAAWAKARAEIGEPSLGESPASPQS